MKPSKFERRLAFLKRVEAARYKEAPPGPCEKHPDWRPDTTGRAPMPAHLCPVCEMEAMANRSTERERYEVDPANPPASDRVASAVARWRERRQESGEILPGSAAEANALERIADLRSEESARDDKRGRGPHAILCGQRYSGGQLREIYAVRPGGRGPVRYVELSP